MTSWATLPSSLPADSYRIRRPGRDPQRATGRRAEGPDHFQIGRNAVPGKAALAGPAPGTAQRCGRTRKNLAVLPQPATFDPAGAVSLADRPSEPTLSFGQVETRNERAAARETVEPVMIQYLAGDLIVRPGETVTADAIRHLDEEYRAVDGQSDLTTRTTRLAVLFAMIIVLSILTGYYAIHNEPRLVHNVGRLAVYLTAFVLTAGVSRLVSYDPLRAEIVPLLVTTMVLAIAYNQELALLTAFALSLLITLGTTAELSHFVELVSTAAAAVIPLSRVRSRSTLIKVGLSAALSTSWWWRA